MKTITYQMKINKRIYRQIQYNKHAKSRIFSIISLPVFSFILFLIFLNYKLFVLSIIFFVLSLIVGFIYTFIAKIYYNHQFSKKVFDDEYLELTFTTTSLTIKDFQKNHLRNIKIYQYSMLKNIIINKRFIILLKEKNNLLIIDKEVISDEDLLLIKDYINNA